MKIFTEHEDRLRWSTTDRLRIVAETQEPGMMIQAVAARHDLCEDEDWLWDVANEMDQEDGLIRVYGPGDEGVMAFTDFGIEALVDLIEIHEVNPDIPKPLVDPQ